MEKLLTISKLDAAKRQLETVIRMYFNSGDPVSMHTLAAAGYTVVRDINKKRGGKPMLREGLFEHVEPEHHKLLHDKLVEAENFFKHADRDHDATLGFNPDMTEFLIMDACYRYAELTGEMPPLFQIYSGWMMMTHQEIFAHPKDKQQKIATAAKTFVSTGRASYFKDMLPVVMNDGI